MTKGTDFVPYHLCYHSVISFPPTRAMSSSLIGSQAMGSQAFAEELDMLSEGEQCEGNSTGGNADTDDDDDWDTAGDTGDTIVQRSQVREVDNDDEGNDDDEGEDDVGDEHNAEDEHNDEDNAEGHKDELGEGEGVLRTPWVLYFEPPRNAEARAASSSATSSYSQSKAKIITIASVGDFWRSFHSVSPPKDSGVGSMYQLFRLGITPEWEDPANSTGHSFEFGVDAELGNKLWIEFCMLAIGEFSDFADEITGIFVKMREKGPRVGIWLTSKTRDRVHDILLSLSRFVPESAIKPLMIYDHRTEISNLGKQRTHPGHAGGNLQRGGRGGSFATAPHGHHVKANTSRGRGRGGRGSRD